MAEVLANPIRKDGTDALQRLCVEDPQTGRQASLHPHRTACRLRPPCPSAPLRLQTRFPVQSCAVCGALGAAMRPQRLVSCRLDVVVAGCCARRQSPASAQGIMALQNRTQSIVACRAYYVQQWLPGQGQLPASRHAPLRVHLLLCAAGRWRAAPARSSRSSTPFATPAPGCTRRSSWGGRAAACARCSTWTPPRGVMSKRPSRWAPHMLECGLQAAVGCARGSCWVCRTGTT
jgi:hypothetical protein